MMMSLGMFVFSLPTLAYQELQRKTAWTHAENKRVGARAANQFLGPDADRITLGGLLVPDAGGRRGSLDELRAMGDQGGPWPLVDGTGAVLGSWVIENVDETQSVFFEDGVPRKTDFGLSIKRVDEPAAAAASPAAAP